MRIRPARRPELPLLQAIERAAGKPFRAVGMPAVADDEPPPLALLENYRRSGRCWVSTDETSDLPVGYLIADRVDGAAHIEQISVDPVAARRGVGRALIDHLMRLGRGGGTDRSHTDDLRRSSLERALLHAPRFSDTGGGRAR